MQSVTYGLARRQLASQRSRRLLSVVAWGRNAEGQCGVDTRTTLVTEPAELDALAGQEASSISAGGLHSAAVLQTGEVLTWGSGQAGKLGHGVADNFSQPSRVEALVGRADVGQVALGNSHTLFLDREGAVWSCGENKEGQCGLGTPIEQLAQQRRDEWAMGANMATMVQAFADVAKSQQASAPDTSSSASHSGGGGGSGSAHVSNMYAPGLMLPLLNHKERQKEMELARQIFAGAASMKAVESDSMFGTFKDAGKGVDRRLSMARMGDSAAAALHMFGRMGGIMPGQHHTPMRIGRDAHPLLSLQGAQAASAQLPSGDANAAQDSTEGISSRRVADVAASRYFSLMRTECGEVWVCGSGFNGELGQSSSWITSASQVAGPVREVLAENGNATAVKCGSTFSMALTASGRVVVWGGIPGVQPPEWSRKSGGVVVAEVCGLPPITDIAAGHTHCLMTDGERVWAMGTWLQADGSRGGTPWGRPQEVAGLPACGISGIAAGARASAAVTGNGQLWMWGRLMAGNIARGLVQQQTGKNPTEQQTQRLSWEGLGSDGKPQQVPGLHRVSGVQIGAAHVLALVN